MVNCSTRLIGPAAPIAAPKPHLSAACETLAEYLTKDDRTGVYPPSRLAPAGRRAQAASVARSAARLKSPIETREGHAPDDRRGAGVEASPCSSTYSCKRGVGPGVQPRQRYQPRRRARNGVLAYGSKTRSHRLRRAFPVHLVPSNASDFALDAPADYPDSAKARDMPQIGRDLIDPIERAYALMLRISDHHRQPVRRAWVSGLVRWFQATRIRSTPVCQASPRPLQRPPLTRRVTVGRAGDWAGSEMSIGHASDSAPHDKAVNFCLHTSSPVLTRGH